MYSPSLVSGNIWSIVGIPSGITLFLGVNGSNLVPLGVFPVALPARGFLPTHLREFEEEIS